MLFRWKIYYNGLTLGVKSELMGQQHHNTCSRCMCVLQFQFHAPFFAEADKIEFTVRTIVLVVLLCVSQSPLIGRF